MDQSDLPHKEFRINPRRSRLLEHLFILQFICLLLPLLIAIYAFDLTKIGFIFRVVLIFLVVIFILPQIYLHRRQSRLGQVSVDQHNLRIDHGLPSWLGGKFDSSWNEISRISVIARFGTIYFYKYTSSRPLALCLIDWIPVDQKEAPPLPDLRATPLWATLQSIDIFRALLEKGPGEDNGAASIITFDLAQHPATRIFITALILLFIGLIADGFLTSEAWAEWKFVYILPHILISCLIGIAVGGWLLTVKKPKKIPLSIVIALGWLAMMVGGVASWLGGIHVNQWLGGPLEAHAYTRNADCDTLLPKEPSLPPIEYTGQAKDYWCQFPLEKEHTVVLLRRGLGGLYTVDLSPHTKAIRKFRAKTKIKNNKD